ncbi:hypothetical protein [Massilia suwonensis]|uniref:Lipoprotein n=1 Tax=Massilia suwonensis TaxID=648895 RepID=A0ABW0MQ55_9BURK
MAVSIEQRVEASMNMPLLIAAVCTGLPGCAAQAPATAGATAAPSPRCAAPADTARTASALPARAAVHPEPERGSIAASGRVPSHTVTPSSRAMAAALARDQKTTEVEKHGEGVCPADAKPDAPEKGG